MRLPKGPGPRLVKATRRKAARVPAAACVLAVVVLPLGFASGALAADGQIAGEVTSASGSVPLEGIEVCALEAGTGALGPCATTGASGKYTVPNLEPGEYKIRFSSPPGSEPIYITRYYKGVVSLAEATPVAVTAGETTSGIDAEMLLAVAPENTESPEVTGTPAAGEPLSCSNGSWEGEPAPSYTYRWLSGGMPIAGATESSYTVQAADEGHNLSCEVTATNIAGKASASSPNVTVASRPVYTEAPAVAGTPAAGEPLSCSNGSWEGEPETYTYQWLRDGAEAIAGATKNSYTVQAADEGHNLSCEVTATNIAGKASAVSAGVAVAAPTKPMSTTAPQVTTTLPVLFGRGAVTVALSGEPLSCSTGSWAGRPAPAYTYRWLRDGAEAIAGATESGYTVQAADETHSLTCEVTATNTAGSRSATSTPIEVRKSGGVQGGVGEQPAGGERPAGGEQLPGGGDRPAGKKSLRIAVAGSIETRAGAVFVPLRCASSTGGCAAVTVQLTVLEPRNGHAAALAAAAKQTKRRAVIIGSVTVTLREGRTDTVKIPLNSRGRTLVRGKKFAAQVRIVSAGHVVANQKIQLGRAASRRRGPLKRTPSPSTRGA